MHVLCNAENMSGIPSLPGAVGAGTFTFASPSFQFSEDKMSATATSKAKGCAIVGTPIDPSGEAAFSFLVTNDTDKVEISHKKYMRTHKTNTSI